MNRILAPFAILAALLLGTATARAEEAAMDHWPSERAHDLGALQSGARTFANYCLNCHSASLMRWNRLHDIGLDDRQIKDFLIFGNQKVGDLMTIALKARRNKIVTGAQGLVGETGVAQTALAPQGKVFVHGELWDGVAPTPLPVGQLVQVRNVNGLLLEVEPLAATPPAEAVRATSGNAATSG